MERCLDLGETSNNARLNTALIRATLDVEEALVAPVLVPGVGNNPVVSTGIGTPANHLDGMAAELLTTLVLIDTTLVGEEVLVHSEGTFNGAVGEDLSLDLGNVAGDRVGRGTILLVLSVGLGIAADARTLAGRSGAFAAAWRVLASAVMVAVGNGVG